MHRGANYPRGAGTFRTIADYLWRDRLADVARIVVEVRRVPAS